MKCPECGTWTEVLETRVTDKNQVTRRRECANTHRFRTYEIVIGIIKPKEKQNARRRKDSD
jgi:transcriptional regulator NrdR family protein